MYGHGLDRSFFQEMLRKLFFHRNILHGRVSAKLYTRVALGPSQSSRRNRLRIECAGEEIFMESSILLPYLAPDAEGPSTEGTVDCGGNSDACFEPQRTDAVVSGPKFFLLGRSRSTSDPFWRGVSLWTRSAFKRVFDCACVLLALPVLLPLLLVIGAAVRLTSRGPVFFLQKRAGMHGRNFTIFKFRSMMHVTDRAPRPVTTLNNQRFTQVGPFLRRWKLDELPQVINVLRGDMSLVGPRPRLPEHVLHKLPCRPGLSGPATIAFAKEESILARIHPEHLDSYYRQVVLPAKQQIDAEYLAQATFFSDIGLLFKTVLRRWDTQLAENYLTVVAHECVNLNPRARAVEPSIPVVRMPVPIPAMKSRMSKVEQASAV